MDAQVCRGTEYKRTLRELCLTKLRKAAKKNVKLEKAKYQVATALVAASLVF